MHRDAVPLVSHKESGSAVRRGCQDRRSRTYRPTTNKDAVAHVTELARESVRATVESGQSAPLRRHYNEMPSYLRSKEIGRAIIPVEVERNAAWPTPPYQMSAQSVVAKPV